MTVKSAEFNKGEKYETIIANLMPFESDLEALDGELWANFTGFLGGYQHAIEIINNLHRKLKIGIIGQVKAGKSSFLNELLFNGEEVLPQAATPMTAALTVISHGEAFSAELTFYNHEDWERIKDGYTRVVRQLKHAQDEYRKRRGEENQKPAISLPDISHESIEQLFARFGSDLGVVEKSSFELVKAAETLPDFEDMLGQSQRNNYDSLAALKEAMPNFVGVNGKLTPLVKSCRLELKLPSLEDIDLVDTPGMNDPIVSRGMKTREYLKECDAVFLLSPASQFLDMTDLDLLRCYLPGEGISSIELVASKFDSALNNEARRYKGNLYETRSELQKVLAAETGRKVKEALNGASKDSILQRLRDIKPLLASSYMAGFARKIKEGGRAEVETAHAFKLLKRNFPTTTFDDEMLASLSGMQGAHDCLGRVKGNKDRIFSSRLSDIDSEKEQQFSKYLNQLLETVTLREKLLVNGDFQNLESQMHELVAGVDRCSNKIGMVFDDELTSIRLKVNSLIGMIEEEAASVADVQVDTKTEKETYRVKTSLAKRIFTLGICRWETRTCTTTTRVADAYEAIGKLEAMGRQARRAVQEEMEAIFGSESFKAQIRVSLTKAILDHIVTGPSFEQDSILIPLRKAINRLSVARFTFDESAFVEMVSSKFSGAVTDREVDALRKTQRTAVSSMVEAIVKELNKHTDSLMQSLRKAGDVFGDTVIKGIESERKLLEAQLKDRKGTIERYVMAKNIILEAQSKN